MPGKTALITGATGLVGKELVRLLLSDPYYDKIKVLSRRELAIKDNRLEVIICEDFDKMEEFGKEFNAHDVYCCLGTTMKRAGSKEIFKKIDLDYPLQIAKIAKDQPDFDQYLIVTAVGASKESPLFYNKIKGEVEDELMKMNLKSLKIFRPSLLLGYRDDFRIWEEIAKILTAVLSFFMIRGKSLLWAIKGKDVAKSMLLVAKQSEEGTKIYKPKDMININHNMA